MTSLSSEESKVSPPEPDLNHPTPPDHPSRGVMKQRVDFNPRNVADLEYTKRNDEEIVQFIRKWTRTCWSTPPVNGDTGAHGRTLALACEFTEHLHVKCGCLRRCEHNESSATRALCELRRANPYTDETTREKLPANHHKSTPDIPPKQHAINNNANKV